MVKNSATETIKTVENKIIRKENKTKKLQSLQSKVTQCNEIIGKRPF